MQKQSCMRPTFWETAWQAAIDRYILFFENYLTITETVKHTITDYIDQRCENGRFTWYEPVCRGTMIWQMQEQLACAAE